MLKTFFFLLWMLLISNSLYCQSYGLQFYSHEVVPEERTSLNLTTDESICLKEATQVSFDLKFARIASGYFGYIIRIVTTNDQNIDLVYSPKLRKFKFVIGESFSRNFAIDSSKLFGEWNHFIIQFNNKSQEVELKINNQLICKGTLNFNTSTCCKIVFGTNNLEKFKTIDVPPMQIKDISISEGKTQQYFYPLSENNGNNASEIINSKVSQVTNPNWISPLHNNWKQINKIITKENPSVAFDKKRELLYIVSIDSLFQLSLKNNKLIGIRLSKSMINLKAGNQSIFDGSFDKLYNIFIDKKLISAYNKVNNSWQEGSVNLVLTGFWHANKFISSLDNALYIVGGYGNLQYKNLIQRYSFQDKKWETIPSKGDFFMPRYLAGLGTNAATDTAYIIGGYGSKSGDQTINPKYNHELLAYSILNHSFKKIYSFKPKINEFCFSNSLVIDDSTNHYYGLVYPIDRFNSSLQLIKGSLSSPEYELLGDSIPYLFHDIESFSDLFYCPSVQKLVAVTISNPKNQSAVIKVFTLNFPPNNLKSSLRSGVSSYKWYWVLLILIILSIGFIINFVLKKRRNLRQLNSGGFSQLVNNKTILETSENIAPNSDNLFYEKETVRSSIFLFGHFEVIDREGNDISRLFSPLLKEMFLLIIFYTLKDNKGVSSEKLYETLWEDKPIKDARNNFSVNILKLKSLLEKVGETKIYKEHGKWRFEILNESIKLDYQQFINLSKDKLNSLDKKYINELLTIINKGALLKEIQYNWMDDFKETVSDFIITTCLSYTSKANLKTEPEFILKLSNCIFNFDQMNEEALSLKCGCLIMLGKQTLAKETYSNYCKEFKKNYGEDFTRAYSQIIYN